MNTNTDFEELVVRDAMNKASDAEREYLRTEALDDWLRTLTSLVVDIDAQFAACKSRIEDAKAISFSDGSRVAFAHYKQVEAAEQDWRRRATRYKQCLIRSLQEARPLVKERNRNNMRDEKIDKFYDLVRAIQSHRKMTEEEYDPSPADVLLWDALDQVCGR